MTMDKARRTTKRGNHNMFWHVMLILIFVSILRPSNMVVILQTAFSKAFSWRNVVIVWSNLNWNLFTGPINNKPALFEMMGWRLTGDSYNLNYWWSNPPAPPVCVTQPRLIECMHWLNDNCLSWKHLSQSILQNPHSPNDLPQSFRTILATGITNIIAFQGQIKWHMFRYYRLYCFSSRLHKQK